MCTDASEKGRDSLGLFLHPAPNNAILPDQEESCEVYYTSWAFHDRLPVGTTSGYGLKRLVSLGDVNNMCYHGNPITTTWRNIYIIAQPSTMGRKDGAHLLQRFLPDKAPMHYRIPRTLIQTFSALEFFPLTGPVSGSHLVASTSITWQNTTSQEAIRIILGTCIKACSSGTSTPSPGVHYAWAEAINPKMWYVGFGHYEHNCDNDHIDNWTNCEHEFGDAERKIRLKFTRCPYSDPARVFVLGLGLAGSIYDDIQDSTDVPLHAFLQRQAPTPSP